MLCHYRNLSLLIALLLFSIPMISGQNQSGSNGPDTIRLKIYMDCDDCDFAYFRRNLPYVDFVRDPKLSDVHLMVTEQRTASNGRFYGFNFLGSDEFSDINYKLDVVSPQSDTDLQTWNRLIKTTRMGLMPYLSRTGESSNLDIQYTNDIDMSEEKQDSYDEWNYWVFRASMGSELDIEESQSEFSTRGSFRVDRITDILKFRSDIMYYRSLDTFEDTDGRIESLREEIDLDLELVYSLGARWSLGGFSEIRSSTFENSDFSSRIGPAIEYNIFPWDQSDRRVFSFGYHINAHYFDYEELTIFDLMSEFRVSEALRLNLILKHPWGEVETELVGSHYFHDFTKNRLTLESRISVNITKGISLYTELDAGLIHDQLSLPAGEVSIQELLLRQRELESAYEFSAELGISFTFGSIYNNIVNQRL